MADDLVIAERAAGYAQMSLVEKPAQLFLYSNGKVMVIHQRSRLGQVVQRIHGAAVSALHQLPGHGACADALRLWLPCGAVEAVVLLLGLQHGLGENGRYLGCCVRHELLHALCQVFAAGTESLCSLGLPLGSIGHVIGIGNSACYVQEDAQLQVVKRCRAPLGVILDLLWPQQGSTRCFPPSMVILYPNHRKASHAPS